MGLLAETETEAVAFGKRQGGWGESNKADTEENRGK
jgi:hypothetical protein